MPRPFRKQQLIVGHARMAGQRQPIFSASSKTPRGRQDARLAVLTGLRRWAEPASSQLLITVAAIIVSIVAAILTVSDVGLLLRIGIVGSGLTYIVVADFVIYLDLATGQRRKMAHARLRAFEDGITLGATSIVAITQPSGTPGARSWWDEILAQALLSAQPGQPFRRLAPWPVIFRPGQRTPSWTGSAWTPVDRPRSLQAGQPARRH